MWCVNVGHRREELAERDVRPGDGAVLQHAVVHDERAVGGACHAHRRSCAGRPRPCLLHHRRLLGGRDRAALHAVLQQCARPAGEEADPVAAAAPITARPICRRRSTAARATATGWTAPTNWSSSCPRRTRSAGRDGMSIEAFADFLVDEFRETVARLGADRIGAFVGEPMQASGGVIVPPDDYLPRIRADLPRQRHPLHLRRGGHRLRPARRTSLPRAKCSASTPT